ncbi:MAG: DUF3800 domain-containing protein [Actinomycetaceae bacterium]|nr:DUF3800 domain-containing protein [Actinomycetaceae bacterium]
MLIAYIDEIGEPGAFVDITHERYNTSPAFGYGGFIIPARRARDFGAQFSYEKKRLFSSHPSLLKRDDSGKQFEAKGSSMFRKETDTKYPQNIRVFRALVRNLRKRDGKLFYYADEKPIGTQRQTRIEPLTREREAMMETLNRIATYAKEQRQQVFVLMDSVNEKARVIRVAEMYAHIFARAAEHEEMKVIIEPPMHLDSRLSSNIQFADWVAAFTGRAIDRQLVRHSPYMWINKYVADDDVLGAFTYESKLHLHNRSIVDFHHSKLFYAERPLYPGPPGSMIVDHVDGTTLRRIKAAAEKSRRHSSEGT